MLYLGRKLNESIVINNHTVITVVEIGKNSIKLAIKNIGPKSPSETIVLRKEIYDRITEENLQASKAFNVNDK